MASRSANGPVFPRPTAPKLCASGPRTARWRRRRGGPCRRVHGRAERVVEVAAPGCDHEHLDTRTLAARSAPLRGLGSSVIPIACDDAFGDAGGGEWIRRGAPPTAPRCAKSPTPRGAQREHGLDAFGDEQYQAPDLPGHSTLGPLSAAIGSGVGPGACPDTVYSGERAEPLCASQLISVLVAWAPCRSGRPACHRAPSRRPLVRLPVALRPGARGPTSSAGPCSRATHPDRLCDRAPDAPP